MVLIGNRLHTITLTVLISKTKSGQSAFFKGTAVNAIRPGREGGDKYILISIHGGEVAIITVYYLVSQ